MQGDFHGAGVAAPLGRHRAQSGLPPQCPRIEPDEAAVPVVLLLNLRAMAAHESVGMQPASPTQPDPQRTCPVRACLGAVELDDARLRGADEITQVSDLDGPGEHRCRGSRLDGKRGGWIDRCKECEEMVRGVAKATNQAAAICQKRVCPRFCVQPARDSPANREPWTLFV